MGSPVIHGMLLALITFISAVFIDALLGDPLGWPHPVRWIGAVANRIEALFTSRFGRSVGTGTISLLAVIALVLTALIATLAAIHLLLSLLLSSETSMSIAFAFLSSPLLAFSFSSHELNASGRRVQWALEQDDLVKARKNLSMIVSRQTDVLNRDEIIRGTVESLSENWLDSVGAPLMWALVGHGMMNLIVPRDFEGALFASSGLLIGAWFYRCVNTLDAMWGYRNERYIRFGKAAALLDDTLNYLPARISAVFLIISSLLLPGASFKNALLICGRDGRKSRSPNSGWVEAACAGAVGMGLGGPAVYSGTVSNNPTIGEGIPGIHHISLAIGLNRTALALFVTLISLILILVSQTA